MSINRPALPSGRNQPKYSVRSKVKMRVDGLFGLKKPDDNIGIIIGRDATELIGDHPILLYTSGLLEEVVRKQILGNIILAQVLLHGEARDPNKKNSEKVGTLVKIERILSPPRFLPD